MSHSHSGLKVLMLTSNPTGLGTYWRAFYLGEQLARRGHTVTLISTSRHQHGRVTVTRGERMTLMQSPDLFSDTWRSGWDPWNVLNRLWWLRNRQFRLVHAFESRPAVIFPALFVTHKLKIPLVMDWADWFGRGGSVEERPNPLIRALLRPVETFFEEHYRTQAQGTTVICSLLREKALALGVPAESIRLIPNGSDTERLQPIPLAIARREMGLSEEAFIVGYLGAVFRRDADLMAQSFDILCERIPNIQLLMMGHNSYDICPWVQQPQRITQLGYLETQRLNLSLAACDILWLPLSDTNANRGRFPLKLSYYLAVGRPIVATAVGDLTTVFAQASIGLLSPPNPQDFAVQTLHLYGAAEQREEMGRQARLLAETHYAWDVLAEPLEALYRARVYSPTGDFLL